MSRLVALDLETTGLNRTEDRIVEVACVTFRESGVILDEYATLVRAVKLDAHGLPVDPLTRIHGIQASTLIHAPAWSTVAGAIADRIDGATIVGHNARHFDVPFLLAALARVGYRPRPAGVLDTLERDRLWRQTTGKHRLVDACAAWRIPLEPHRALADTRATIELAVRQAALYGWAA